jgi:hypothetical protein
MWLVLTSTPAAISGSETASGRPVLAEELLRRHLRRLRESHRISREQAGGHFHGSEPKISRIELGRTRIGDTDLDGLLALYRVKPEQRDAVRGLAAQFTGEQWWHQYTDVLNRFPSENRSTSDRPRYAAIAPPSLVLPEPAKTRNSSSTTPDSNSHRADRPSRCRATPPVARTHPRSRPIRLHPVHSRRAGAGGEASTDPPEPEPVQVPRITGAAEACHR